MRNSDSVIIFRRKLNSDIKSTPRYFYVGKGRAQVLHTRLRTKCSSLNDDLFQKRINDSPLGLCGNVENTDHYFCVVDFTLHREQSLFMKSQYTPVTLQILLFRNPLLSLPTSTLIFEAVDIYITDTKRF